MGADDSSKLGQSWASGIRAVSRSGARAAEHAGSGRAGGSGHRLSAAGHGAFLYLHGGGWVAPLSGKHLAWAKRMANLTSQSVYCVEYSLAPERPFPQGLEDCRACYEMLRTEVSGHIAIGGAAGRTRCWC